MASDLSLFLVMGKRKCLLSKPSDFAHLMEHARETFGELEGVADNEVTFSFTPESISEEVELHPSGFQFVHDKASLRIETRKRVLPTRYEDENDPLRSGTTPKRVKTQQSPIDLTLSPPSVSFPLPIAASQIDSVPEVILGSKPTETHNLERMISRDPPEIELEPATNMIDKAQAVKRHFNAASHACPSSMSLTNSEPSRSVDNKQATARNAEFVSITNLSCDRFLVSLDSVDHQIRPRRQVVETEWVGCIKPWSDAEDDILHHIRILTGRSLQKRMAS